MKGTQHDPASSAAFPLAAYLLFSATQDATQALAGCAGYIFGAVLLTPDLDTRSSCLSRWKRWFRLAWIWAPYRKLFKHRGISHAIVLGTASRVLYLGAIATLVYYLTFLISEQFKFSLPARAQLWYYRYYLGMAIAGIELSAWVHYLCDGVFPLQKQLLKIFKVK
jgi:uncharacterized metal-binding protein